MDSVDIIDDLDELDCDPDLAFDLWLCSSVVASESSSWSPDPPGREATSWLTTDISLDRLLFMLSIVEFDDSMCPLTVSTIRDSNEHCLVWYRGREDA